jgi:hypothetical protein
MRLLWTTIVSCTGWRKGRCAPEVAAGDEVWGTILSREDPVETCAERQ